MNKVFLSGNVGSEIDAKPTASGKTVCRFSLAINKSYTDKSGQKQDHTDWLNCVAWEKRAEWIKDNVKKGSRVMIEGSIKTGKYEKDGVTRSTFDVQIERIMLVASPGKKTSGSMADEADGQDASE